MRAKAMVVINQKEISQAQALGMKEIPQPVFVPVPFVFHLQSVIMAYVVIGPEAVKVIKIVIGGNQEIMLEHDEALWLKIDAFIGG